MVDLTVGKAFKMSMEFTHWRVDANLIKKYFENSAATIDWLEDMGVEFAEHISIFPSRKRPGRSSRSTAVSAAMAARS